MHADYPILQQHPHHHPSPASPNAWRALLDFTLRFGLILVAWVAIGALRIVEPIGNSLVTHGLQDEFGHVLTALMVALAIGALRLPIPLWSILLGGVILDFGHIPDILGFTDPISGSTRNGTHSVFAITLLALVGFLDWRRANVWLGITLGALSHLWRDLGTGLVPLAWPLTDHVWGTSFERHWVALIGVTVAILGSAMLLEIHARANPHSRPG